MGNVLRKDEETTAEEIPNETSVQADTLDRSENPPSAVDPPPAADDFLEPPMPQVPDLQISLNIGGQKYSTTTVTLVREPRSLLAEMIGREEKWEKIEKGEELFIDRDGQFFGHILNYLRDGDQWILPSEDSIRNGLVREAEFYKLDGLVQLIKCAQNMKIAMSTLKDKPAATVKILILGDSGVGKTSLLERYCDGTFNAGQASTIGVDYRTKLCSVEGKIIKFYFWDTTGQERFRSVTRSYYRGSKGVIFVYDVTSRASFVQLKKWMKDFEWNNSADGECRYPKILVANKIDLDNIRVVSAEEGAEFARENHMTYVETSAKTKVGVQGVFEEMMQQVLQNPELWEELDKDAKRMRHGDGFGKRFGICC